MLRRAMIIATVFLVLSARLDKLKSYTSGAVCVKALTPKRIAESAFAGFDECQNTRGLILLGGSG